MSCFAIPYHFCILSPCPNSDSCLIKKPLICVIRGVNTTCISTTPIILQFQTALVIGEQNIFMDAYIATA